ncbi:anthranilate phosphoribosyltransferase [Acidobacteria bacterium AH-259-D05]|nr:anthranilate phosphoribosyltransferase [Acidobacteria bacterium AH-259-D05]
MSDAVSSPVVADALRRVVEKGHLSRLEAEAVMEEIMSGNAHDVQIAAFLTALRMKGETVEELTGFAQVMRARAAPVKAHKDVAAGLADTEREMLVDTCGTGGDASNTFNVSTATAFVVAGAGLPVAKHGNRSVSSLCGSADVVEALGVDIELAPWQVARCIDEIGIGFLYAPLLHRAMQAVMLARREMKIRTVFNILGPLCNPASANSQILGVYGPHLTEPLAQVLKELGTHRAFVVHGADGLDEISNTGPSKVAEVRDGIVYNYQVSPEDFGLSAAKVEDLRGGSVRENADIILEILRGKKGPRRDIVLMNAAAAIMAGEGAANLKEGVKRAAKSINSGAALGKLEDLIAFSNSFPAEAGEH